MNKIKGGYIKIKDELVKILLVKDGWVKIILRMDELILKIGELR